MAFCRFLTQSAEITPSGVKAHAFARDCIPSPVYSWWAPTLAATTTMPTFRQFPRPKPIASD
uniref:Uncharacterized protein n=1 Tax=Hyaloperonospora arabidopsidis (strain Emoy2) TaxID=559515 RepID=M4BQN6_HYAAE